MSEEKKKADEIYRKYFNELESAFLEETDTYLSHIAKNHALIHVEGILNELSLIYPDKEGNWKIMIFYKEVKQILESKL